MTVVPVLKDSQRFKLDTTDDAIFYSEPRFVHHLDAGFRARLTALYRERIPPCAQVLDLQLGEPPAGRRQLRQRHRPWPQC